MVVHQEMIYLTDLKLSIFESLKKVVIYNAKFNYLKKKNIYIYYNV